MSSVSKYKSSKEFKELLKYLEHREAIVVQKLKHYNKLVEAYSHFKYVGRAILKEFAVRVREVEKDEHNAKMLINELGQRYSLMLKLFKWQIKKVSARISKYYWDSETEHGELPLRLVSNAELRRYVEYLMDWLGTTAVVHDVKTFRQMMNRLEIVVNELEDYSAVKGLLYTCGHVLLWNDYYANAK